MITNIHENITYICNILKPVLLNKLAGIGLVLAAGIPLTHLRVAASLQGPAQAAVDY